MGQRVKKTVRGTVFSDERHSRYRAEGGVAVAPVKKGITDQNHVGNLNPFRYRGYYYDTESQLYYLMTRYYDPVVHRFLNADGYYQSGGALLDTNMNAYCGNNPVSNFDPDGTCWIPVYSTCGAQMGSKWKMMGSVPGVPYCCKKCGKNDPSYSVSESNKNSVSKPAVSYVEKIGETAGAILSSLEFDAGAGYGLGLTMKLIYNIGFSLVASADLIHVKLSPRGSDIGMEFNAEAGISAGPAFFGWDENQWQSFIGEQDLVVTRGPKNDIDIVNAGGYLIIGGQIKVSANLDYIIKRLGEIWC